MADILTEPKELKLIVQDSIFIKFTDLFFVVSSIQLSLIFYLMSTQDPFFITQKK